MDGRKLSKTDALIFIGAVGIAVRAIAPHCKSKATDPAVIVLDERGRFSIPILSGHLGGANDLAKKLASICGAVPVITTATDIEGVFAVDEWAKAQNCHVLEPGRIKTVSSTLLAGKVVYYDSQWKITGTQPKNVFPADENHQADFSVTLYPQSDALHLVPKSACLASAANAAHRLNISKQHLNNFAKKQAVHRKASVRVRA